MEFTYDYLETKSIQDKVIFVYLNRPEVHNAFNEDLISELSDLGEKLSKNHDIRVVVLSGNGNSFCAGADLNWMKKTKEYSYEENISDSKKLGKMFHILDQLPQAVIGRVNGSAIGGGIGLVSICDISVAIERSKFGFSEVNLGISPAVISPFVLNKIGGAHAREYFLTGERFSSTRALEIGLVNYVAKNDIELETKVNHLTNQILSSGPQALKESKQLLKNLNNRNMAEILELTSELIAKLRTSEEGQEGISAFLEKRKTNWFASK